MFFFRVFTQYYLRHKIYYICGVKITTVLLSIFFLMITMFPCADEETGDTCGTEVHFHSQSEQNHSEEDVCPPFCICQCCHSSVTNLRLFNNRMISLSNPVHQTWYLGDLGKDIPDSLLQPPQV